MIFNRPAKSLQQGSLVLITNTYLPLVIILQSRTYIFLNSELRVAGRSVVVLSTRARTNAIKPQKNICNSGVTVPLSSIEGIAE